MPIFFEIALVVAPILETVFKKSFICLLIILFSMQILYHLVPFFTNIHFFMICLMAPFTSHENEFIQDTLL